MYEKNPKGGVLVFHLIYYIGTVGVLDKAEYDNVLRYL